MTTNNNNTPTFNVLQNKQLQKPLNIILACTKRKAELEKIMFFPGKLKRKWLIFNPKLPLQSIME